MKKKSENRLLKTSVIGLALIFCTKCLHILYTAGEFEIAYAYLYYIPIIFASFFYGISGGLIVSLFSSAAYTIFFYKSSPSYEQTELLFNILSFILIGLLTGLLSFRLKRELTRATNLYKGLNLACNSILESFASAVDEKDSYTHKHSNNVVEYASAIARQLELSLKETRAIEQAAQLHDVGKIGIPDAILHKKGELSDNEWAEIKQHPSKSVNILEPLNFLKEIIDTILHHHEKYDGTGYPAKQKGEEIPIGARVIAVADSFDTMLSNRPYREALKRKEAVEELKNQSGKQFDPKVVEAFLTLLKENKL